MLKDNPNSLRFDTCLESAGDLLRTESFNVLETCVSCCALMPLLHKHFFNTPSVPRSDLYVQILAVGVSKLRYLFILHIQ